MHGFVLGGRIGGERVRLPVQAAQVSDMKCTCVKQGSVSRWVTTLFLAVNHNDTTLIFANCMT